MCLVFDRDIVEDNSILDFLETPSLQYLLRDTRALFLNVTSSQQYTRRSTGEMVENIQSVLWYSIEDADFPECLEPPLPGERRPYYPTRFRLITRLALIRRSTNEKHGSWKIDSCNFRQMSTACKKMQRLIACRACPEFPCYSKLIDSWLQSVDYRDKEPNETTWKTWLAIDDNNTQIEQKIKYLQESLGAGHNARFEFVHPNDTRGTNPFTSNLRSYTEHSWDGIEATRETKKENAKKSLETKRLKKEKCPSCIFSDYCERWSIRSCNGPCTKEYILRQVARYDGPSWGLLNRNNCEKLALVASVSDHQISRVFRHTVTIGRMCPDFTSIKLKTRRKHTCAVVTPDELILLLRADRGSEWLAEQWAWARENPMSEEAMAMYIELCQRAGRWSGLGCGYFGSIRTPQTVTYHGGTRFTVGFSSGYDMKFDGFASLWHLKQNFELWERWKNV